MDIPGFVQWGTAIFLVGVFAWVALDTFTDILPWEMIDRGNPNRTAVGVGIMVITGSISLVAYQDLMEWVWLGLKHILALDILEMETG